MMNLLETFFGSKLKAYFYLALFVLIVVILSVIGINRMIESKKNQFQKSEPTSWESIKTYKDMLIK